MNLFRIGSCTAVIIFFGCSPPASSSSEDPSRMVSIHTWKDLQDMRRNLAGNYILGQDIVFPALGQGDLPREGFEPIGHDSDRDREGFQGSPFTGTFNGNGHSIIGLRIQRPDEAYVGFFGRISQTAQVQNVQLRDVSVQGKQQVGSIVGYNQGGRVNGRVEGGSISNAYGENTGGLVGYNGQGGTVTGSVNMRVVGSVSWWDEHFTQLRGGATGGLVGRNVGGTVKGHAAGEVDYHDAASIDPSESSYGMGGLVGINSNGGKVIGYSSNTVSGSMSLGGLVGSNSTGGLVIGYATGTVNIKRPGLNNNTSTGGLVGSNNGAKLHGYFTGKVTAPSGGTTIGSLAGRSTGESSIITGYSRGTVNGQPGSLVEYNSGKGDRVQADANTPRSDFAMFPIGSEPGKWSFPQGQSWPSINLGTDPIFADAQQPASP